MLYNYTSARVNAGKVPFIQYNADTNEVDLEDLMKWVQKYIAKKTTKSE
jgi:hypothetical protein